MAKQSYEVIIIGGSYAGLSAAMALGRSQRHALVIDSGLPCNRFTPRSHNFITHDGDKPAAILQHARAEVSKYATIVLVDDLAVSGRSIGNDFEIVTRSGKVFEAKKLLFATGIRDILPDNIPGFAACWGKSVIHCPYCHGYEFRNQKTAILAKGEKAIHLARLVRQLTTNLTIVTSGKGDFAPDQSAQLAKHEINTKVDSIVKINHTGGQMQEIEFSDGTAEAFDAMYTALPFSQHCDIPAFLSCTFSEGGYIQTDGFQQTSIEGVFAAGDCAQPMRSVAQAIAGGNMAGAAMNYHLAQKDF